MKRGKDNAEHTQLSVREARYAAQATSDRKYDDRDYSAVNKLTRELNEKFHGGEPVIKEEAVRSFIRHVHSNGLTAEDFMD